MVIIILHFLVQLPIQKASELICLIDILDNVGKEEVCFLENICGLFDSKVMHREITKTMKWLLASKAYSTQQIVPKCPRPEISDASQIDPGTPRCQ